MIRLLLGGTSTYSTLMALLAMRVNGADLEQRDGIHRLDKAQVTAFPAVRRRDDGAACPTSHQSCPSSLNGGCCPDGYACATDSCFATTQGPMTCGGKANYYACAPDVGGGCCPSGFTCDRGGRCLPPAGVIYSHECPQSSYLCPSSVGYGCCKSGMGCAENQCYSTAPSTYVFTKTVVTTTANSPVTTTTTITTISAPTPPTAAPTADSESVATKFYPTFVPKVSPVSTSIKDPGLSRGQVGGIFAGAVLFLVLTIIAAYLIIRRLNKVVRAVEASQRSSGGSKERPPMHQYRPTASEIDAMSVDPLMMSPEPSHHRNGSDADTPYGWQSPDLSIGARATPSSGGAYQAIPSKAEPSGDRQMSVDSIIPDGYFDVVPSRMHRNSNQSTRTAQETHESQGTVVGRGRHWNPVTETHDVSTPDQSTPLIQELDATPSSTKMSAASTVGLPRDGRPRTGSGAGGGVGAERAIIPRKPLDHQQRRDPDQQARIWSEGTTVTQSPLDVVSEAVEFHGHYGPSDKIVGQTSADYPNPSL